MASEGNVRIEALEHQLMRAWLEGDRKAMKKLLSSRFRLVVGAKSPVLLDRKSLIEAAGTGWRLNGYRVGNSVYSRTIGPSALFAAELELKIEIDGVDLSGSWWMADYWRRSGIAQRWQLADRQMARIDEGSPFPDAVRGLQLWR
ncbi:nuclear transport factor 2 family protein [Sphingomonas glaciei]|uniref:Nuclear transport factor 2 family protein n=1 Tax=Sphingomonas glaciei TaxID=2938948 RepID=A0ABY5MX02_9SPHN|nr:nuclear transport factor 2 family protein [Sphingomonas glaciei]UUR08489.1 nuclear transport factor 2 family protein [Sphingomonas glaciei]